MPDDRRTRQSREAEAQGVEKIREKARRSAHQKERFTQMTVEDILDSDTHVTAAALKTAFNGVYVDEVYKGRAVRLEKTDTAYIINLNNPNADFLPKNSVHAVEIIKRELGNLAG